MRSAWLGLLAAAALAGCDDVHGPNHAAEILGLSPPPAQRLIEGSGDDDVWIAANDAAPLVRWDGRLYSELDSDGLDVDAVSHAGGDVWIGGHARDGGAPLRRWRDGSLQPVAAPADVALFFAAAQPDDLWAGGARQLMHYDGSSWSTVPSPRPLTPEANFTVGVSRAPDEVWAYYLSSHDASGLMRFDGSAWSDVVTPSDADPLILWVPAPNQPWIALDGTPGQLARREADGSWTRFAVDGAVVALGGRAADDGFAIVHQSAHDLLYHFDGSRWRAIDSASWRYQALWVSPTSVWVLAVDLHDLPQLIRYAR